MGDDQENTTPDIIADIESEQATENEELAGADGSSPSPGKTEEEKLASGQYFRNADGKLKKNIEKTASCKTTFTKVN